MRVLAAVAHDALEFSALAFNGIGAPDVYTGSRESVSPCCILGHGEYATSLGMWDMFGNPIAKALARAGISGSVSDRAVYAINRRKKVTRENRVTFAEWCRELGVVRGE